VDPPPAEKTVGDSSSLLSSASNPLFRWVWFGAIVYVIGVLLKTAYRIRMGAIDEFGPVIHEFDPYFNYRATEVSAGCRVVCWLLLSAGGSLLWIPDW